MPVAAVTAGIEKEGSHGFLLRHGLFEGDLEELSGKKPVPHARAAQMR